MRKQCVKMLTILIQKRLKNSILKKGAKQRCWNMRAQYFRWEWKNGAQKSTFNQFVESSFWAKRSSTVNLHSSTMTNQKVKFTSGWKRQTEERREEKTSTKLSSHFGWSQRKQLKFLIYCLRSFGLLYSIPPLKIHFLKQKNTLIILIKEWA